MTTTWSDVLNTATQGNPKPLSKVSRTPQEWQQILPPDVYQVTRMAGTERPFSSESCHLFEAGVYACRCCHTPLFDASQKFESGTGWPSFNEPLEETHVAYTLDRSHGMDRVEVTCNTCDAHLGHVFPDGPAPSGLRYCMNGLALQKTIQD